MSIPSFFSTLSASTCSFFKNSYDALLYVYNSMAHYHATPSTPSSPKKEKHTCHAGCGIAGCAYDEKHHTTSYKKAKNDCCAANFFTPSRSPRQSFSHGYCLDGSNVRRRV